jgi:hypothetical protein
VSAAGAWGPGLDQPITATAGDFVYIPANVPHQPANASATGWLVALVAALTRMQESTVLLQDPRGPKDSPRALADGLPGSPDRLQGRYAQCRRRVT